MRKLAVRFALLFALAGVAAYPVTLRAADCAGCDCCGDCDTSCSGGACVSTCAGCCI